MPPLFYTSPSNRWPGMVLEDAGWAGWLRRCSELLPLLKNVTYYLLRIKWQHLDSSSPSLDSTYFTSNRFPGVFTLGERESIRDLTLRCHLFAAPKQRQLLNSPSPSLTGVTFFQPPNQRQLLYSPSSSLNSTY